MKANKGQIERALKAPAETRFFLFHGPDEAGSRALMAAMANAVGTGAERVDLSGALLKGDPARLADEAASISLFGGTRYIVVEPAGEEVVPAVEALLESERAGNPVAIVAGALKPSSRLLKIALGHASALSFASYAPEGREADRLVIDLGRELGLTIRPDVARRIADASGGNRAIIGQELEKFALYADAAPGHPQEISHDMVQAVGAASEEGDLSRLVESVGGGDAVTLHAELLRLSSEGMTGVPLIRAVLRRMMLLARLRGEVERGNSVDAVMASQGKAIFWKEKDAVTRQLSRWRADLLARSIGRLMEAEQNVKAPGTIGTAAVDETLFAICRQAARLR
ncbi:DNA polymerase III subunit delta [Sphingosinicella rhizophila]|uniref:DNA-directed DNA polymerase n=1 Tax=Sphingosinicella rhizophila TaxID=3050082 RepID=A0ABU3Q835_9SPHN|nr:DNA polymerase III subunit delta [Sphingosinicella sp. GR2756]MDT9599564.1 DNA polymerase III subunit delta [Sphingosinicella sp. GR2756]